MSDPKAGKYQRTFELEYRIATAALRSFGGALAWGTRDYEAFIYRSDTVCLIFYPHRSSAGNYSIRVRDQSSADKKRAMELMLHLRIASGFDNTFAQNRQPLADDAAMQLAARLGLVMGWARLFVGGCL